MAIFLAPVAAFALTTLSAAAATSYPNDYFFVEGDQWALSGSAVSINAPAAWCAGTGSGVVVADVDTGATFNNEDLAGKLIAGAAFLGGTAPDKNHPTGTGQAAVTDDNGHGSMTTGIMVASTGNGKGIAAVAPDARALIVKVLGSNGSGYESDVADGIDWAVDHGANVINLSIGPGDIAGTGVVPPGTPATSLIPGAIQYAFQHGVAVAVAAGNSGISTADYLSIFQQRQALTVGALGPGDQVASYSNYGYQVSIFAPGGDAPSQAAESIQNLVVSTGFVDAQGRSEYFLGEGTSFAAPHVAGVLALLMARGMTASQAMAGVVSGAGTSSDGFPQLDAAAAMGRTHNALCGSPSTTGTVAPPGGVTGPGGQHQSVPPPPSRSAATAVPAHSAPPAAAATAHPSPTAAAGGVEPGGDQPQQGGRKLAPPPGTSAPGSGGGATPNPLLLAGLTGVVVVGAPAAAWLVRAMRPPSPPH